MESSQVHAYLQEGSLGVESRPPPGEFCETLFHSLKQCFLLSFEAPTTGAVDTA